PRGRARGDPPSLRGALPIWIAAKPGDAAEEAVDRALHLGGPRWLDLALAEGHHVLDRGHAQAQDLALLLDHDEAGGRGLRLRGRSEEHTSELQSRENLVCRL